LDEVEDMDIVVEDWPIYFLEIESRDVIQLDTRIPPMRYLKFTKELLMMGKTYHGERNESRALEHFKKLILVCRMVRKEYHYFQNISETERERIAEREKFALKWLWGYMRTHQLWAADQGRISTSCARGRLELRVQLPRGIRHIPPRRRPLIIPANVVRAFITSRYSLGIVHTWNIPEN
jgi:hypothetical protein